MAKYEEPYLWYSHPTTKLKNKNIGILEIVVNIQMKPSCTRTAISNQNPNKHFTHVTQTLSKWNRLK